MFISWLSWSLSVIADCFVIFPEKVPEMEGMASLSLSLDDGLVNRAHCEPGLRRCQGNKLQGEA
jgi:hypothetical protein